MNKVQVEYIIPLPYLITMIIGAIGVIWAVIKFYFKINKMGETVKEQEKKIADSNNKQAVQMKELEDRLEKVKTGFDEKLSRVNNKLDSQRDVLIEIRTTVNLLVEKKIQ